MAGNIKGLTVVIDGNVTKLSKAIASINTDSKKLQRELKGIDTLLKFDPKNTALLAQKQQLLTKELDLQAKKLKELKEVEAAYAQQLGPHTDEEIEGYRDLQREIVATEKRLKEAQRAMADFSIEQGVMNSALGKAGAGVEAFGSRIKPAGQLVESIGGTLSRTVTPAIIATGAATVAAAVNIDTSLTNVKKTVDGTDQQYQQLKDSAIEFSKTNAVSASQILDIQALGAQLGFAIEELDEFGRVVSGLDIATNMDAEQAATEMAQFANITKMSHGEISNYGSAIVGLGNSFATTESSISSMAMRIAASGTQVGMSQADILGLTTALSSMGVEAEAGGTAVSTIMARIDKDIALSSESVETWASTAGMSAQEFADAWRNDPVQALAALLSNMEAATEEGGNMSVMLDELGISSIRQTDVMKRLAGNSEFVADAVAKSNEEWVKNSALQAEVDNRNASLAAQFEILKNRVIAVADDVGGPLAEAMLEAIDAAEPLIQAIADGARQFSEMSKEEQQTVLQAVALAAALGPLLSLFGKGMQQVEGFGKGMQGLAKFFAEVDFKTSGASQSVKNYGKESKAAESAVKSNTEAVKASSVAMGAAKAAAIGLAIAGIAVIVGEIKEYIKRQEDLDKATNGLRDSIGSINEAYLSSRDATVAAGDSSAAYAKTLGEVQSEVGKAIEKQAELADSIRETLEAAGADIGRLDSYKRTIEELAGESGLSAEKQAELKLAVDNVNEACGTNYEVVRDAGGAYVVMKDGAVEAKDAILDLIEAQEIQVRIDASKSAYEEAYKGQAEAARTAADATAAYTKAKEEYDEVSRLAAEGDQWANENLGAYRATMESAEGTMNSYNDTLSARKDIMSLLHDEQLLLTQAQDEGAGSISNYVATNDFLLASLQSAGVSCLDFSGTLGDVGASVADLGRLNEEEMSKLAQSYDGTYGSIAGLLSEYGVSIDEAKAKTQIAVDGMSRDFDLFQVVSSGAFVGTGTDADEFVRKLAEAGTSTEQFQSLTADQLTLLVQSYDGNIELTKAKLDEFVRKNGDAGTEAPAALAMGIDENSPAAYASFNDMLARFDGDLAAAVAVCRSYGFEIPGEIADGIYENEGTVTFAAGSLGEKAISELTGKDYSETGVVVDQGMAEGIGDGLEAALAAAGLGDDVIKAIMEALDSHSPSRRAREAGETVPAGLAEGIDGSDEPGNAAQSLGETVITRLGEILGPAADLGIGLGDEYSRGIGGQAGNALSNAANVALNATGGLGTGDPSAGQLLGSAYAKLLGGQSGNAGSQASGVAGSATSGLGTGNASAGTRLGSEFGRLLGLEQLSARLKGATVAGSAKEGLGSVSAQGTGSNFANSFKRGMSGVNVWGAAYSIGLSALNAIKSALGIASPSKRAAELADYTAQGFINDLEKREPDVYDAGYSFASSAYDGLEEAASSRADGLRKAMDEISDAASAHGASDFRASVAIGVSPAGSYPDPSAMQGSQQLSVTVDQPAGQSIQNNYYVTFDVDDLEGLSTAGDFVKLLQRHNKVNPTRRMRR